MSKSIELTNKSKKKIIHIFQRSVFLVYFLEFLDDSFTDYEHIFLIYGTDRHMGRDTYPEYEDKYRFIDIGLRRSRFLNPNVVLSSKIREILNDADIVIVHALHDVTFKFLFLHQRILKKTIWIVWGEDVPSYHTRSYNKNWLRNYIAKLYSATHDFIKKIVTKQIPYVVALSTQEYLQICQYWSPEIKRLSMENLYIHYQSRKDMSDRDNKSRILNIIVGHSGWVEGNHLEVLHSLEKYKDENIRIYLPLSYGNASYIDVVKETAVSIFGDKVIFLSNFMDPSEYHHFLTKIDIGIYNAKNQTGLGNIDALIGIGAKVFINQDGSNWEFFSNRGYHIYPVSIIDHLSFAEFQSFDPELSNYNIQLHDELINKQKYIDDWRTVYNIFTK